MHNTKSTTHTPANQHTNTQSRTNTCKALLTYKLLWESQASFLSITMSFDFLAAHCIISKGQTGWRKKIAS